MVPVGPDGKVRKFDDMPVEYQRNIDFESPFDRHPGEAPAMSTEDIADIVAFLRTLTDGFAPTRQASAAEDASDLLPGFRAAGRLRAGASDR